MAVIENIYGPREFHKAISERAADLCMPNLMRIGDGIGWMRSAAIAGAAGGVTAAAANTVVLSRGAAK